jgi:hypothetical protein
MGAQRLLLRVGSAIQIRYLVSELRYLMFGKGAEKAQMIEAVIWKGCVAPHANRGLDAPTDERSAPPADRPHHLLFAPILLAKRLLC